MEAPDQIYAKKKRAAEGGKLEDYVTEYHSLMDRQLDILSERGLSKENAEKAWNKFTTLDEAGLLNPLPSDAKHYGIDTVAGFYESTGTVVGMEGVALVLGLDKEEVFSIRHQAAQLLGDEYCKITESIQRYL